MSTYAKSATLVFRFLGALVALAGVLGPLYVAGAKLFGVTPPEYPVARWIGCAVWFVVGVSLVLGSRPLGRHFASGLD
jgi:hypothetical protein